ncbi:ATP-binding cassette domain-containing protein [Wohlfahrtiimonas chitiniclastica]|uniref:methionine ABC transporter ATP-binding protein n=1 Tax=Wohlfahrtiimonas chitiniclastica TaxID=400946 RepID=UPI001BD14A39|nr:ATP-binding cassette domain-containing protein [Wohlfahrtiimonas chitiniclastica]MBS7834782.1 ATP-binding cassette domain-containing protein [Wohlfahrtiimonas chitiniclastica]
MIEFQNITKSYLKNNQEVTALHPINLTINKGDVFGVIGYSGAGKSTLIRLVNALEWPTSGNVIINGQSLQSLSPTELRNVKKRIGMIFQHFNLLETKTVAENIALPLKLNSNLSKAAIDARVDELLAYVEIPDKKHAYPRELSGGQKQRVGIARALANNPDILLCDEATSALDPQTTQSILNLLRKINQEQGITIMMVTHQMEVVTSICNRIAVMDKGVVVETGSTKEIFQNPAAPMTRKFINTLIEDEIPKNIIRNIDDAHPNHIYRLEFLGDSAKTPVVNELILNRLVVVNFLFSNMIEIEGSVIGSMFVQFIGDDDAVVKAVAYLRDHGVRVTHNQLD